MTCDNTGISKQVLGEIMKMLPIPFLATVCCSVSRLFRAAAEHAAQDLNVWYMARRRPGVFLSEVPQWVESVFHRVEWLKMEHQARLCAERALEAYEEEKGNLSTKEVETVLCEGLGQLQWQKDFLRTLIIGTQIAFSEDDCSKMWQLIQPLYTPTFDAYTLAFIYEGLPFLKAIQARCPHEGPLPPQLLQMFATDEESEKVTLADRLLTHLSRCCPHLEFINAFQIEASNIGLKQVAQNCPNLLYLDADGAWHTDSFLRSLQQGCPKLIGCDLFNRQLTAGAVVELVNNLPNLIYCETPHRKDHRDTLSARISAVRGQPFVFDSFDLPLAFPPSFPGSQEEWRKLTSVPEDISLPNKLCYTLESSLSALLLPSSPSSSSPSSSPSSSSTTNTVATDNASEREQKKHLSQPKHFLTNSLPTVSLSQLLAQDSDEHSRLWRVCRELGVFDLDLTTCSAGLELLALLRQVRAVGTEGLQANHGFKECAVSPSNGDWKSFLGYKPPGTTVVNQLGAVDHYESMSLSPNDLHSKLGCREMINGVEHDQRNVLDKFSQDLTHSIIEPILSSLSVLLGLASTLNQLHASPSLSELRFQVAIDSKDQGVLAVGEHIPASSLSVAFHRSIGFQVKLESLGEGCVHTGRINRVSRDGGGGGGSSSKRSAGAGVGRDGAKCERSNSSSSSSSNVSRKLGTPSTRRRKGRTRRESSSSSEEEPPFVAITPNLQSQSDASEVISDEDEKEWVTIWPRLGCCVVSVGECLALLTNNVLRTVRHRSLAAETVSKTVDVIYFARPQNSAFLIPFLPFCTNQQSLARQSKVSQRRNNNLRCDTWFSRKAFGLSREQFVRLHVDEASDKIRRKNLREDRQIKKQSRFQLTKCRGNKLKSQFFRKEAFFCAINFRVL